VLITAGLFFTTYESVKGAMGLLDVSSQFSFASLVVASCCGETVCYFSVGTNEDYSDIVTYKQGIKCPRYVCKFIGGIETCTRLHHFHKKMIFFSGEGQYPSPATYPIWRGHPSPHLIPCGLHLYPLSIILATNLKCLATLCKCHMKTDAKILIASPLENWR